MEMYILPPPPPSQNMSNMGLLTFLHERILTEIYPNMFVALSIFATLPVTVAAAERSFSKLKLIQTYLRSTMMQTHLNNKHKSCGLQHVSCYDDDVIDDFAGTQSTKVQL